MVESVGCDENDCHFPEGLDQVHDELEFRIGSLLVEIFCRHASNVGAFGEFEEVFGFRKYRFHCWQRKISAILAIDKVHGKTWVIVAIAVKYGRHSTLALKLTDEVDVRRGERPNDDFARQIAILVPSDGAVDGCNLSESQKG